MCPEKETLRIDITGLFGQPDYLCLTCGKQGHKTKKCPYFQHCGICGSTTHRRKDCKFRGSCTNCGEMGHTHKNCPQGSSDIKKNPKLFENWSVSDQKYHLWQLNKDVVCNKCGEKGHTAKRCYFVRMGTDLNNVPSQKKDPRICKKCGKLGHLEDKCLLKNIIDKKCYNCDQTGHKPADCPYIRDHQSSYNNKPLVFNEPNYWAQSNNKNTPVVIKNFTIL